MRFQVSYTLLDNKRSFQRLITKTNSGSLTPERERFLKEKINDPDYISMTIEKLADDISQAFFDGYLADHDGD